MDFFWRRDYVMNVVYSVRECHFLKITKIEINLKIRIVHWVCCSKPWWSAVLIIIIFQKCAKHRSTKSLVNKKVDLCNLWGNAGAPIVPPTLWACSINLSKSFEATFKIKELPKLFSKVSKFSMSYDFDISMFFFFFYLTCKILARWKCGKIQNTNHFYPLFNFSHIDSSWPNQTPPSYLKSCKQ